MTVRVMPYIIYDAVRTSGGTHFTFSLYTLQCIANNVAVQITLKVERPQRDDQRAEKAIKEVCLSISRLLNTKNDLRLRWTGCLTDSFSKSRGCSLISWMTGQFLPSAKMYKTGNF